MKKCKNHGQCKLLYRNTGHVKLDGIYRVYLGRRRGQHVWIVNGDRVFGEIYPAFIYGGNEQRYRYNPPGEIWIDDRIAIDELEYTILHELHELELMRQRGWTYDRAHSSAIAYEKKFRLADMRAAARHERSLGAITMGHIDKRCPSELRDLRVNMDGVYRRYHGKVQGLDVWIVDGTRIRRDIYGDFCFGGHGLKYPFVPRNEIWLEGGMSVTQVRFTLVHELAERKLMAAGKSYADAYELALIVQLEERERQARLAARHEAGIDPVRYGTRDRGVKAHP